MRSPEGQQAGSDAAWQERDQRQSLWTVRDLGPIEPGRQPSNAAQQAAGLGDLALKRGICAGEQAGRDTRVVLLQQE